MYIYVCMYVGLEWMGWDRLIEIREGDQPNGIVFFVDFIDLQMGMNRLFR